MLEISSLNQFLFGLTHQAIYPLRGQTKVIYIKMHKAQNGKKVSERHVQHMIGIKFYNMQDNTLYCKCMELTETTSPDSEPLLTWVKKEQWQWGRGPGGFSYASNKHCHCIVLCLWFNPQQRGASQNSWSGVSRTWQQRVCFNFHLFYLLPKTLLHPWLPKKKSRWQM